MSTEEALAIVNGLLYNLSEPTSNERQIQDEEKDIYIPFYTDWSCLNAKKLTQILQNDLDKNEKNKENIENSDPTTNPNADDEHIFEEQQRMITAMDRIRLLGDDDDTDDEIDVNLDPLMSNHYPRPPQSSNNNNNLISKKNRIKSEFLIIDTRNTMTSFVGGNIIGAMNIPHISFKSQLNSILSDYNECKMVIFYCMYSQKRGFAQRACNWYTKALMEVVNQFEMNKNKMNKKYKFSKQFHLLQMLDINAKMVENLKKQSVFLLKGGFNNFINVYIHTKPQLIERYEQSMWHSGRSFPFSSPYDHLSHMYDM